MALLWIEGFEGFGTTPNATPAPTAIIARKYPIINRESEMKIQNGRYGLCLAIYYAIGAEDYIQSPNLTTDSTLIFGAAIKILSTPTVLPSKLISLYDGVLLAVNIRVNTDGTLAAYRGDTLLGTSSLGLSTNTWYYLELKVVTHQSAGTVDLVVNMNNWLSLSGIDTQAGSNAYASAFRLGPVFVTTQFDDIYLLDGSGTINNDFLGNRKVEAIRPTAAGSSTDWTPDSGDSYARVNEVEVDDDSSYVETATTTDKDLYAYENLDNMNEVNGIQIMSEVRVTAGSMDLHNVIKSSTTEDDGTGDTVLSTDYVTSVRTEELNPHTAVAWTPAEVDAAEFGIKAI